MLIRGVLISGLIISALTTEVDAQNRIPSVVQLPSFQTFSYNGTVVVPDSGGAYLGGNKTSRSQLNRRWLNRGFGFAQGNSQLTIHPTIIDNNEIDQQLLGGTPQQFLASGQSLKSEPGNVARRIDPTEEGKALVRFARKLYREGKETASFDTYRMAIGALDGRLRELAKAEFRRVFGSAADQTLRMSSLRN